MRNCTRVVLLSLLPILVFLSNTATAQLRTDFYKNTCPNVESLVRDAVMKKLQQTVVTAPATLRLFFHDCFVRGCDASILLASPSNTAEKDHPDNLSLAGDGFDTVIKAKAAVDSNPQCRNKVSCADILAIAARDVVNLKGGPFYKVELGRRDGRVSTTNAVQNHLPSPDFNMNQLTSLFAANGLNITDLVALSGAHTIGFSHCSRFTNRIYGPKIDPTLNPEFTNELRKQCPQGGDTAVVSNLDPTSPDAFDNAYFRNLQGGKGLLTSDQVLFTDNRSKATVNLFASKNKIFNSAFAEAMTKLGKVGVLTGKQGEIRIDCTKPN
ncbi:hypothetical protein ACS0TY_017061 [Phlomoides rotata]